MTLYGRFVVACCCLLAYLVGSIPFGLLLGRLFGAGDIRKIGSGNIGATNMLRTGRKGLALATLILDFLKGIFGIALAQACCNYFFRSNGSDFVVAPNITWLAGLAAVLGHVFPVWLRFKGGKGVATTLGVFLVIQPVIGLCTMAGWLLIFYLSRVSSLSSIGSIACAPVLGYLYADADFIVMSAVIAAIVIYKHKENIARLREGNETKWEKKNDPS